MNSTLNRLIAVFTLLYGGVLLLMAPFFGFNVFDIPNSMFTSMGIVLIISGFMLFLHNKLSDQINFIYRSIVRLNKEGIKEFNLVDLVELFDVVRRYDYSGQVKIVMDYQYVNRVTIELFENLRILGRLKEIKLLITNYHGEEETQKIENDRDFYQKRIFFQIINEFKLGYEGKFDVKVSSNSIFPMIFIFEEKVSLLVPYDYKSRKFVHISSNYYSEIGDRYRYVFDELWLSSAEYNKIGG